MAWKSSVQADRLQVQIKRKSSLKLKWLQTNTQKGQAGGTPRSREDVAGGTKWRLASPAWRKTNLSVKNTHLLWILNSCCTVFASTFCSKSLWQVWCGDLKVASRRCKRLTCFFFVFFFKLKCIWVWRLLCEHVQKVKPNFIHLGMN